VTGAGSAPANQTERRGAHGQGGRFHGLARLRGPAGRRCGMIATRTATLWRTKARREAGWLEGRRARKAAAESHHRRRAPAHSECPSSHPRDTAG
jgi:hypothetical protein